MRLRGPVDAMLNCKNNQKKANARAPQTDPRSLDFCNINRTFRRTNAEFHEEEALEIVTSDACVGCPRIRLFDASRVLI